MSMQNTKLEAFESAVVDMEGAIQKAIRGGLKGSPRVPGFWLDRGWSARQWKAIREKVSGTNPNLLGAAEIARNTTALIVAEERKRFRQLVDGIDMEVAIECRRGSRGKLANQQVQDAIACVAQALNFLKASIGCLDYYDPAVLLQGNVPQDLESSLGAGNSTTPDFDLDTAMQKYHAVRQHLEAFSKRITRLLEERERDQIETRQERQTIQRVGEILQGMDSRLVELGIPV